jgi:hypothetical protein
MRFRILPFGVLCCLGMSSGSAKSRGLPHTNSVIILLFGPPGSGKDAQSRLLSRRIVIPAVSKGDRLRAQCRGATALGKTVETILSSGGLVPDELVDGVLCNRISHSDCARGFVLDGYPHTISQAQFLADFVRDRSSLLRLRSAHRTVRIAAAAGLWNSEAHAYVMPAEQRLSGGL